MLFCLCHGLFLLTNDSLTLFISALVAVSFAKKAATTMRRNAAAIKQEILDFCQSNTREYEVLKSNTRWRHSAQRLLCLHVVLCIIILVFHLTLF